MALINWVQVIPQWSNHLRKVHQELDLCPLCHRGKTMLTSKTFSYPEQWVRFQMYRGESWLWKVTLVCETEREWTALCNGADSIVSEYVGNFLLLTTVHQNSRERVFANLLRTQLPVLEYTLSGEGKQSNWSVKVLFLEQFFMVTRSSSKLDFMRP